MYLAKGGFPVSTNTDDGSVKLSLKYRDSQRTLLTVVVTKILLSNYV